ncbi:MAG: outer membrane protein assembly factor, partial [Ignavibacteriales bacterium]|nr:outer membrane protein assembly factor [Ignavibacteriales bacterium]
KNIRITADLSYLTELTLNFYGFNGYESIYIPNFEDDQSDEYISRVYYHHQRKFIRFTCDLQGNISGKSLKWFGGIGYFDFDINSVDVDKLNSGKAEEDKLPEEQLLYDKYVDIGIIGENEKDGGIVPSLKAGIVYDTRDNEPNPMTGTWSEAILFYSVPAFTNSTYSYLKIAITHRQYFTLKKNVLSLAYRVGYQGTLAGKVPFYMQPYMITSFAKVTTTDGLGGSKTLRGILRNRVVGDGIAYGNLEMRWKFFKTVLWNQNIYLAFNTFADAGRVLQSIHVPEEEWASIYPSEDIQAEKLHIAVGAGFRVALNQNFIVAFDYGKALDTRDGIDGFYAGIGYLF